MTVDDKIWKRIKELMPPCPSCGAKTEPGSANSRHIAVCLSCSHIVAMTDDAVDDIVDQARAEIEGET